MLSCPFCGASESERIDLDGRRFIVFPCMFTPEVDPALDEAAVAEHLRTAFGSGGDRYFRGMCDRLHLYVTKGAGSKALREPPANGTG